MKKYFLHNGAEQQGPFDIDGLKAMSITKDTPVWYDGLPDWTTAGKIDDLKVIFISAPPPFKTAAPPAFNQQQQQSTNGSPTEVIGIFTKLKHDETMEIENPTVSFIHFEKGAFFKKYDSCVGKIYLTNQRIRILKLIVLEAKNMKLESAEQFGSALGQWFDIELEYISKVSTPRQGLIMGLLRSLPIIKSFTDQKKEELEIEYQSPMEVETKSLLFGTKKARETFVIVISIDNKNLWNMKLQTSVAKSKAI